MRTKKEQAKRDRDLADLREAQKAFHAYLSPEEKAAVVDALHAEANAKVADEVHWRWAHLLESLANDAASAQKAAAQFAAEFAVNPGHALRWSNTMFRDAARLDVAREAGEALRAHGPTKVRAYYEQTLLRRASSLNQSTSPASNLYEDNLTAAVAKLLETLRWAGF